MTLHSQSSYLGSVQALRPITQFADDLPRWEGAVWIGEIDCAELTSTPIQLVGAELFSRARFLVWKDDRPLGSVEVPIRGGLVDGETLRDEAGKLPDLPATPTSRRQPPISIVICTRD